MTFPVFGGNASGSSGCYVPTGKKLTNSLRFRASASAYLNRTPASASNQKIWTWSGWVKRGALSAYAGIFGAWYGSGTGNNTINFNNTDNLRFYDYNGLSFNFDLVTTQVFRDPSAWYHIAVAVDTTQVTAENRIKIYVNGSQITSFSTASYPTQNSDGYINSTNAHYISYFAGFGYYFDGYLAEVNFIDGQALSPTSFGQFDPVTGVWVPVNYTGTYGTNGFYLPFTNTTSATTLAYDQSGNGNNWTPNNISTTAGSTYDAMTDVPTLTNPNDANYATWNPIGNVDPGYTGGTVNCIDGNLNSTRTPSLNYQTVTATMTSPSGKFYAEFIMNNIGSTDAWVGTTNNLVNGGFIVYHANGNIDGYGAASAYTNGDVIGVAVNVDSQTTSFYKNNVFQATVNFSTASLSINNWFFAFYTGTAATCAANFGQQPFAYTPPAGFLPLNTFNLPCPTIWNGANVMNAVVRNGFGASGGSVTSLNFKPDFYWKKVRNATADHFLLNSITGVGASEPYLSTNTTNAEATATNYLLSFNNNGYTLGTSDDATSTQLVEWVWNAGSGVTSTNTNGSITSTVSVNPTAGFSVVTYTGNGVSGATVGHSLGVAPAMVIVKDRNLASSWLVKHQALSSNNNLFLEGTNAQFTPGNGYIGDLSSSSTFSLINGGAGIPNVNANGDPYIAYCWAAIPGYSAFGSYTGNGSTDGPFIYTGFRPRYFMLKRTDRGVDNWEVLDTSRAPYNTASPTLCPNLPDAEFATGTYIDFVSNGFKIRATDNSTNGNGGSFIYAAFAENPFKYANAR